MNLRHIEAFVAAAELGTMTAAGERLRVTPSAISLSITALERAIGTQLLIRRPARGLTPTPTGAEFLRQARDLLAHAEDVRTTAELGAANLSGHLTVGCYRTAAPFILPRLLKSFGSEHPEVTVDFLEGPQPEIEDALLGGRCEVAVMFSSHAGPGIEIERIYATAPYVLLPDGHSLADGDAVDLRALESEPFVSLDVPPSGAYEREVFKRFQIEPEVRYRSSGYELCRSLVAHGLGWALLISRPHGDLSYDGLPVIARPILGDTPRMDVGLAWPHHARPTRRARAFADHCKEVIPEQMGTRAGPPVTRYIER